MNFAACMGKSFHFNINLYYLLHRHCLANSLDENLVKGKIVLCYFNPLEPERRAFSGATGVVIADSKAKDFALSFPLPATFISTEHGNLIYSYIKSTRYSSNSDIFFLI